jgi:hemolysin III
VPEQFGTWAHARSAPGRPRLRGYLHLAAFLASVPAGIALVRVARDGSSRVAALVFAVGLWGLYGVSATYHRFTWRPKARANMRRADHSMIFVLIAATYTAVALLVLSPAWQRALLGVVWAGALIGIGMKIFVPDATRKATGALYIILGWAAVLAFPQFISRSSLGPLLLIAAGGISYTAGAIVFALKRPNPSPLVFGYHEIWHVMVVGGSACHYAAIRMLLTSGM